MLQLRRRREVLHLDADARENREARGGGLRTCCASSFERRGWRRGATCEGGWGACTCWRRRRGPGWRRGVHRCDAFGVFRRVRSGSAMRVGTASDRGQDPRARSSDNGRIVLITSASCRTEIQTRSDRETVSCLGVCATDVDMTGEVGARPSGR